jgi:hypothetical protein
LEKGNTMPKPLPKDCPHCKYERQFPGFETGGWIQMANNGPIVSCPVCNDDCSHPRNAEHWTTELARAAGHD